MSIRRDSSEEKKKRKKRRVRARIFIDHSIHADVNNKERGWPISLFYFANPLAIELAGYCVGMSKTNGSKEREDEENVIQLKGSGESRLIFFLSSSLLPA